MSPKLVRRVEVTCRDIHVIRRALDRLTDEEVTKLIRRGAIRIQRDGLPPSSPGTGIGRGRSDTSGPERAALDEDHRVDVVAKNVRELEGAVSDMRKMARRIEKLHDALRYDGPKPGRESSLQTECLIDECGNVPTGVGGDRLRGGLCPPCDTASRRWKGSHETSGDPASDRRAFRTWRNEALKARKAEAEAA
ncbi:MAG: hypothetical protein KGI89_17275 [Euryarchaeota archaeon]|nr:hypothetical protein [Euryarchaeota archaeon]